MEARGYDGTLGFDGRIVGIHRSSFLVRSGFGS
jgi:hypothetical protein